ncbi:MAG: nitroreductase family protein, partial [Candidatus Aminicenantes bacterium]|nr:nitroreductase family protein [Candidatus Aminicenantes bacterium]
MKRRTFVKNAVTALPAIVVLGVSGGGTGKELEPILLPEPEKEGGKSVLAAIRERRTNRSISMEQLPPQTLSNLLWAAFGVNRPDGQMRGKPGRTAASASNSQEIDLYVALPHGVFLYEAVPHRLT